jgi:hypothetical protein
MRLGLMDRTDYEQGKLPTPLRELRKNPTFPEIIFHYLNEAEIAIDTREALDQRTRSDPRKGILAARHYSLLNKRQDVNKLQLKNAWNEWIHLGCYEKGPRQQFLLFTSAERMARLRELHDNLQKLMEDEDKWAEWREQGLKECAEDGRWSEFVEYHNVYEALPNLDAREERTLMSGGSYRNPDNWLGTQYHDYEKYKVY